MTAVARVLIDSPLPQLDRLFDYAIPAPLIEQALPGVRVRVPLRSAGRVVDGYLVELAGPDAAARPLSELDAVVSPVPVLPARLHTLARQVADRAAGSAADVLRLAIPRRQVRVEKAWLAAGQQPVAPAPAADPQGWQELAAFPGLGEALVADERLALDAPAHPVTLADGSTVGAWAPLLVAAAAHTLARGRSTIIAVPDGRDLDQLRAAARGRIPDDALVVDDARRSAPDRYRAYLRTLAPAPCVVLGKRSAVYSPAAPLGLIVLWDDGDPLLQEPLAPYAHPRDAALVRQELDGGALLLAGHTRTTDVQRLVQLGWVRQVDPARRGRPRVLLDADPQRRDARVPSAAFRTTREALAQGPVLVQVARPGYAPALVCAQCRQPARCPACAGALHAAARGATPDCRWCGRPALGWTCPHCASPRLRLTSSGSARTADELGRAFPGVRVILADGDHPVASVDRAPALVVATRGAEPIAEGGYRAVVLLDGERMLLADELRIGESCLRWWSNAAALAAPGAPVHLVGVHGPAAHALVTWTQPAYAQAELGARRPLLMPPTARVAELRGTAAAVDSALAEVRRAVPQLPEAAVLGPVRVAEDPATVQALLRFDYAHGRAVAAALRAQTVAQALQARRRRGVPPGRNTLRVRVDVADPQL